MDDAVRTLALCWRMERRDGGGIALTSHDRPLMIDGVRFRPSPGIDPGAINQEQARDDGGDIAGALSDGAIRASDLARGRWDGASVRLSAVNWESGSEIAELRSGRLGAVSSDGRRFRAEVQGAAIMLAAPACPAVSPTCRAVLGDRSCRVDLAGRERLVRVTAIDQDKVTVDQAVGSDFAFGRALVASGPASGLRVAIVAVVANELQLREMLDGLRVGDWVELFEGCDGRLTTCAGRFANAANFRGEPFVPGADALARVAGA